MIWLFLLSQISLAESFIGFGAYTDMDRSYALIVGDYSLFNQRDTPFGIGRYGGGGGRFQLGNNIGLHLQGNSGFALIGLNRKDKNTLWPMIGVELLNGEISLNSSSYIQDYYQTFVGPSAGVQIDIRGCRMLPLVRAGGTMSTLGKYGLLPEFDWAYGPALHISCEGAAIAYGSLQNHFKGTNTNILAMSLKLKRDKEIVVVGENIRGVKNEVSLYLLLKGMF